jgi:hypothetical protein
MAKYEEIENNILQKSPYFRKSKSEQLIASVRPEAMNTNEGTVTLLDIEAIKNKIFVLFNSFLTSFALNNSILLGDIIPDIIENGLSHD